MARKQLLKENLSDFPTYILDDSQFSPDYFKLSSVPERLEGGKNLLKIRAHPNNLVAESEVRIEILDANGDTVYFEIPPYIAADKSRIISIWVDDIVAEGLGKITILGEAENVPANWKGRPNVKWEKELFIDPSSPNRSEIIFDGCSNPSAIISESIQRVNQKTYPYGRFVTQSAGTVSYINLGSTPILTATGFTFTDEMVGGRLYMTPFGIADLQWDNIADNWEDFDYGWNTTLATVQANSTARPLPEYALSQSLYTTTIARKISNSTVVLASPYRVNLTNISGCGTNKYHTFKTFENEAYEIHYEHTGSNVYKDNKKSVLVTKIKNLNHITGMVDTVKTYIRSNSTDGDFDLIGSSPIGVPTSQSLLGPYTASIVVPVPSKRRNDTVDVQLRFFNIDGLEANQNITITAVPVTGSNVYMEGTDNLVTGSLGFGTSMIVENSGDQTIFKLRNDIGKIIFDPILGVIVSGSNNFASSGSSGANPNYISGAFDQLSASFSQRLTVIESAYANKNYISGAFSSPSSSFSDRITQLEASSSTQGSGAGDTGINVIDSVGIGTSRYEISASYGRYQIFIPDFNQGFTAATGEANFIVRMPSTSSIQIGKTFTIVNQKDHALLGTFQNLWLTEYEHPYFFDSTPPTASIALLAPGTGSSYMYVTSSTQPNSGPSVWVKI